MQKCKRFFSSFLDKISRARAGAGCCVNLAAAPAAFDVIDRACLLVWRLLSASFTPACLHSCSHTCTLTPTADVQTKKECDRFSLPVLVCVLARLCVFVFACVCSCMCEFVWTCRCGTQRQLSGPTRKFFIHLSSSRLPAIITCDQPDEFSKSYH